MEQANKDESAAEQAAAYREQRERMRMVAHTINHALGAGMSELPTGWANGLEAEPPKAAEGDHTESTQGPLTK